MFKMTTLQVNLKRQKYETKRELDLDEEYSEEMKNIIDLVKNRTFVGKKISEHNKYIKKVIENPYDEWKKLETRLLLQGPDASFPEFEGVIVLLLRDILIPKKTDIVPIDDKYSVISVLKEQCIIKLVSLLFKNRVFLPYRQTIITISDTLFFFDNMQRNYSEDPNKNPYFHTRRNYYYQNMLLSLHTKCVLFPSIYGIGSTDLIKVRCVPIFFLGVSSNQLFVDEYVNTSVEFYFHDIQHARRMYFYNLHHYDTVYKHRNYGISRSTYDIMDIDNMYKEAAEFTKDMIMPFLAMENQYHEKLSEEENAVMKFNKMIFFEIIHESAFFISKDLIVSKLFEHGSQTPVESIIPIDVNYPDVKNTLYSDPPILSNLMYKLQSSFYDTDEDRHDYIVPVKYRLSKYCIMSACAIIATLDTSLIPEETCEKLGKLINFKENRPEPPKGYFISE